MLKSHKCWQGDYCSLRACRGDNVTMGHVTALSHMAFVGYFKTNLIQIPAGKMFVKSILTSTEGLIFVYVRLHDPPAQGLYCGQTSQAKIAFKSSHLERTCGKGCSRASNFYEIQPHQFRNIYFTRKLVFM